MSTAHVPSAPAMSTANRSPRLAIGFVLYRPEAGFYERLGILKELGLPVFVFDNAPATTSFDRLSALDQPRLHYATAGNNVGLGVGLSVVCASAHAHGCEYLLFFDQDTRFTAATLGYAEALLDTQVEQRKLSHVALVLQAPRATATDHQPVDTMLAISSGMLFLLHNAARMGWHNPNYFVDGVDYEFCLRARAHRYRIAVCSGAPGFDHVSDQADTDRVLFGRRMRLRKYPWWRVRDSLTAYLKLTGTSIARRDVPALGVVVRSMVIFVLGQCLARLLLRESNR